MSNPQQLVQKLWIYCSILCDDGLSYGDYVEQLTFLLPLKMADEQSKPAFSRLRPIAEAKQLVTEVERRMSILAESEGLASGSLQRAGYLWQFILPKAFSG
jgi:type I restriction-modification system DNA methylase subunit